MSGIAQFISSQLGTLRRAFAIFRRSDRLAKVPVATYFKPQAPKMYAVDSGTETVVAMIGGYTSDLTRAAEYLSKQGKPIIFSDSLSSVQSLQCMDHRGTVHKLSHIIVDVDALGGVSAIYQELRRVRNSVPDLAVILMSSDFSVDDYSLERLPLCDASIRSNFTFAGLEFAFTEAIEVNNKIWQSRLTELQAEASARRYDMTNVINLHHRRT